MYPVPGGILALHRPLLGRTEAQKRPYDHTRKQVIPQLILDIAAL